MAQKARFLKSRIFLAFSDIKENQNNGKNLRKIYLVLSRKKILTHFCPISTPLLHTTEVNAFFNKDINRSGKYNV